MVPVDLLDTVMELAVLRDVGAITVEEIEALVEDARDVNNWKSLQAAIDAGSTVIPNRVDYGIDHMNGTFDEGAVFMNGGSAMHFETSDNMDAATVIFGSMEIDGEFVNDVVIYSSNEDLISVGTSEATVNADFNTCLLYTSPSPRDS